MSATANPSFALRPFLPADAPILAEIFRAAVTDLTGDDYSEAQQEAWASVVEDINEFSKELAGQLTLVATMQASPVGFASLEGKDKIAMLYVHPAVAGQGVGRMLVDALESGCENLFELAGELATRYARLDAEIWRVALQHSQRLVRVKGALAVLEVGVPKTLKWP